MDELRLGSQFLRNFVSSIFSKVIKEKIDQDVFINIRNLKLSNDNESEHYNAHIELDLSMGKDEFYKLMQSKVKEVIFK